MRKVLSWTDFKAQMDAKGILRSIQYESLPEDYHIWCVENGDRYEAFIDTSTTNADRTDFEDNYKSTSNAALHPADSEGKTFVRSEGRPLNYTTAFVCIGDNTGIGDGTKMCWDFSNSDDEITAPANHKRKRVEFKFLDAILLKDGTIYFHNAPKGCYFDFYVVCPNGQYYIKNDGTPALATADTPIAHFASSLFMQGDCPMGDELNTETVSSEIGSNYKFWIEVTTPDTDSTSNGYISLEIYRKRTAVL